LTGVIKFLVVHPNVEIPARRDARANKHWTQSQINEERKTVASGMGDIQAGGKGGAPAKAKVEDYNKFPLKKEKGGLGFAFCGGKDTGYKFVYIIDIYPGGPASKANKDANTMEYGDRIEKIGDNKVTGKTSDELEMMLKAIPAEIMITIHEREDPEFKEEEIEVNKKGGKGLGLSIVGFTSGKGAYIHQVMPGGVAETTGKFRRGDHIIGVNGSELADCKQEEVVAALKGPSGAMKIKIKRFKK